MGPAGRVHCPSPGVWMGLGKLRHGETRGPAITEARVGFLVLIPPLKTSKYLIPTEQKDPGGSLATLPLSGWKAELSPPHISTTNGLESTLVSLFPPFSRQLPLRRVGGAGAGPQGADVPRVHRQPLGVWHQARGSRRPHGVPEPRALPLLLPALLRRLQPRRASRAHPAGGHQSSPPLRAGHQQPDPAGEEPHAGGDGVGRRGGRTALWLHLKAACPDSIVSSHGSPCALASPALQAGWTVLNPPGDG